jgi:hypothetical protein
MRIGAGAEEILIQRKIWDFIGLDSLQKKSKAPGKSRASL